ncbi:MAG: bifunctional diguanylate cyclase/phosphodiesterase, partial [Sedimenticola sp.]|nr:bifunctional diguanylate cyclase/phosphodiesterase [Sedimenticola sp.]
SKRQTENALEYEAQYDGLTTLPNRSQIILHIDRALARARRHGHIGAVMFIDLDHFKNINDSLGHNIGDEVLRQVSRRLVDTLRKEDMVARLGGDEFVVLLSEEGFHPRTVAQQAQLVAEKIRDAVSQTYVVGSYLLNVTPSIGIALFPENNETTTEVLQQADTAMYRAKAEGRNCTRFFLPVMQMLANERLTVEQDLRWALDEGKYQLYYQPQVDSAGSIVGAEVLLRCPGRDGNFNRIDLCIDVAESTGLILPIGEWVLREACQKLKYWSDNGIAKSLQHLCINISPKQFLQRDFVSLVQRVINETNVDAQRIVLEITESSLIDAKMDAIETMKALKALGIRVAMDDFGTGYSSLSYITQLPLDILKIDRSFVSGISHDHKNAAVVEALMAMARQLDLYLIAEGVETSEDLEFLVQKGCKYFQGFHFSRPQSVNEFTTYMERHS